MEEYQQLRSENMEAAKALYEALKTKRVLNTTEFKDVFLNSRSDLPKNSQYNNWETTEWFLRDHKLMTTGRVNGFKFYYATQKCVRTHSFKNATIEYVVVNDFAIDKAIDYQEMTGDILKPDIHVKVITEILGLPKKLTPKFEKYYVDVYNVLKEINGAEKKQFDLKHAILSTIREMKEIKKIY